VADLSAGFCHRCILPVLFAIRDNYVSFTTAIRDL